MIKHHKNKYIVSLKEKGLIRDNEWLEAGDGKYYPGHIK
jgi:hypothetical protein